MATEKPGWAVRLTQERMARGWTQKQTIGAIRRAAEPAHVVDDDHLMRNWHNWEGGYRKPQGRYRELIADAFGVDVDDLFSGRTLSGLYSSVDPETLELLERIRRSDISDEDLDHLAMAIDLLATRYSSEDPTDLLDESHRWLGQVSELLNGRPSAQQQRRLLAMAGWLGLLIGSLSHDMNDQRSTEAIRRFVSEIATDIDDGEIGAWAQELKAWQALNEGDHLRAAAEARIGRQMAPDSPVVVQLLGHEAEALARSGDAVAARKALAEMNELRSSMPLPEMPRHHFQLEARKFDKVEMRVRQLLGDHDRAAAIARTILADNRRPDGGWRRPMLTAKALSALAVHAALEGDVDGAVDHLDQALDIPRQSLPSMVSSAADVLSALESSGPSPRLDAVRQRVADLTETSE